MGTFRELLANITDVDHMIEANQFIREYFGPAREAEQTIRRAQRRAERDGNVIRPESFKRPRKPH